MSLVLSPVQLTQKICELLQLELFLVGGAVRDYLLKLPTHDFDFTTAATPDQIEAAIRTAGYKPYTIGKRFGTIGFNFEGEYLEVTTFRSEKYGQSRKPEVQFGVSLEADLKRRDFTFNALAMDKNGDLIDLFQGISDLQAGLVRTVGVPERRFAEDALRILRGVRFAASFKFELEPETAAAMRASATRLLDISKERWVMELDRMLQLPDPSQALSQLQNLDLLKIMLPELSLQNFSLWTETLQAVQNTPSTQLDLRWRALLTHLATPFTTDTNFNELGQAKLSRDLTERLGKHLRFSKQRQQIICT